MIATDLLAQAEHDVRTRVGLITTDRALAEAVVVEVEQAAGRGCRRPQSRPRPGRDYGEIAVCEDEAAMIAYSDFIAAEHLQVHTRDPHGMAAEADATTGRCSSGNWPAWSIRTSVPGTNHTLPTMAAGRYTGGLWVGAYVKIATHQWLTDEGVKTVAPPAARQAAARGWRGTGGRRSCGWTGCRCECTGTVSTCGHFAFIHYRSTGLSVSV